MVGFRTRKSLPPDAEARYRIAKRLIYVGIGGIVAVSFVAVYYADTAGRPEMSRVVFASVTAMLGTWISTVLAFYFARENFQAASDATRETLKQAGAFHEDSRVSEVMTPFAKINPIELVADTAAGKKLPLSTLSVAMKATNNHRVPVLVGEDKRALWVIHLPHIKDYAQQGRISIDDLPKDATVEELRQIPELRIAIENFVTVKQTSTVADARQKMQTAREGCKDVFVTSDGTPDGSVVGFLTNSDLARTV